MFQNELKHIIPFVFIFRSRWKPPCIFTTFLAAFNRKPTPRWNDVTQHQLQKSAQLFCNNEIVISQIKPELHICGSGAAIAFWFENLNWSPLHKKKIKFCRKKETKYWHFVLANKKWGKKVCVCATSPRRTTGE